MWSKVAGGTNHAVALKTDGTLWIWGRNQYGQLGVSDVVSRSSPVQVGTLTTWTNIGAGDNHALAITSGGTLWAWGKNKRLSNYYGQLGLGDVIYRSSPTQVGTLASWVEALGGRSNTSLALLWPPGTTPTAPDAPY